MISGVFFAEVLKSLSCTYQPAVPTMSPWLSNITWISLWSVKFNTACSRVRKLGSKWSASSGCAPAHTTPNRIKFHPNDFIWSTSAWLNVKHVWQVPQNHFWNKLYLNVPVFEQLSSTLSSQWVVPVTAGMYGGPLTTTFGPPRTIGAPVLVKMNCWSLIWTFLGTDAAFSTKSNWMKCIIIRKKSST